MIDYKFNEGEILKEIQTYVDSTYEQHYATGKIQSTEFILDSGHGLGFTIGMRECLQRVKEASDWDSKFRKLPLGHGIGIGCVMIDNSQAMSLTNNGEFGWAGAATTFFCVRLL